ncbi:hypothetical protein WN48_07895 [Eufriesea mexicana]|uniref:Uncharacterized protein n=1 Tax=Eufriesea mexicana TaxID=516756 RepID=A0A310STD1_9HYME|nr:hypothetical protein WN48_07895 [Eufriesea mexicana]
MAREGYSDADARTKVTVRSELFSYGEGNDRSRAPPHRGTKKPGRSKASERKEGTAGPNHAATSCIDSPPIPVAGRIELDPISRSPISPHIDPPMPCRVGWLSAGACAVTGERSFWGWRKGRAEEAAREPVAMRRVGTSRPPTPKHPPTMSGAGSGPPVSTFTFVQRPSSCWSPGPTSILADATRPTIAA